MFQMIHFTDFLKRSTIYMDILVGLASFDGAPVKQK